MMNRTRIINGRKCVMVPASRKSNSEEEAIAYAAELGLEDFEVARTGVSTWRVYNPLEPKVEKAPRIKREKKLKALSAIEKAAEAIEKAAEVLEESAEMGNGETESNEAESNEADNEVGSEGSEVTPSLIVESHNMVMPIANDITEFGKSIVRTIRNCINPAYPDCSDVTVGDVAELLDTKVNSVKGALKSLVAKDYVTTHIDKDDEKPISVICLTQKGWTAVL